MGFPYHSEPDGNRFAPHHHLLGLYAVGVFATISGIESGGAPVVTLIGVFVGLFAFLHLWYELYSTAGAVGSLAGILLILVGFVIDPWASWVWQGGVLVAALIALDDTLQHAVGLAMPVDAIWKRFLWPLVRER